MSGAHGLAWGPVCVMGAWPDPCHTLRLPAATR